MQTFSCSYIPVRTAPADVEWIPNSNVMIKVAVFIVGEIRTDAQLRFAAIFISHTKGHEYQNSALFLKAITHIHGQFPLQHMSQRAWV